MNLELRLTPAEPEYDCIPCDGTGYVCSECGACGCRHPVRWPDCAEWVECPHCDGTGEYTPGEGS